jgi:poly-gamma-glutamate synthase PgsB/CapB
LDLNFWFEERTIRELLIAGGVLVFLLVYLLIERVRLQGKVKIVPLRICVTGTRGKSSVTRLIAAALRRSGMSVLARTTGAKPVLIFPDGSEEEIPRRGRPTILEGKKILQTGAKLRVDACVVELMGIHPEAVHVESQEIFKPHILVITNVRLDHMAQMGRTKDSVASCFASAIPEDCTIFIPQEHVYPVFQRTAELKNANIVRVSENAFQECMNGENGGLSSEFEENIRLSLAVAEFLGHDPHAASRAMTGAFPDFGSLKVWTALKELPLQDWYFVSGFAANEPESTQSVLSKLRDKHLLEDRTVIGLLNLRGDRGDRTLQWFDALKSGQFPEIRKLICVGDHAWAMRRKLKKHVETELYAWPKFSPEEILARLSAIETEKAVVIGMGNMGGAGRRLVDYWERTGTRHDL